MTLLNSYISVNGGTNNKAVINIVNDNGFTLKTISSKNMPTALAYANRFVNKFQNLTLVNPIKQEPIETKEIMKDLSDNAEYFIKTPIAGNIVKVYLGKDGNHGFYFGIVIGTMIKKIDYSIYKQECVILKPIQIVPMMEEINFFLDEDRIVFQSDLN